MAIDIISSGTLRSFQDYLVVRSKVREIESLFEGAGIRALQGYDSNETSVRRRLVKHYYASLNLQDWKDVRKLLKVFEEIIFELERGIDYYDDKDSERELDEMLVHLKRDGFSVKDGKIVYHVDPSTLAFQDDLSGSEIPVSADLFQYQFPAGLPYGIAKPDFAVIAEKGLQKLRFELKPGMHILRKDVYPNLDYRSLVTLCGIDQNGDDSFRRQLMQMNQSNSERDFFRVYAQTFKMATSEIPVLIPQAWIQWHSLPKRDLRSENSIHADDLYRIDFVAFWANKRYSILIDDISHYARQNKGSWQADEEAYSKRLKEDRKLRRELWQVFRISNWEIKNGELLPEILNDLREFIGFSE